ncbi:unnamed protein product, partial [Mesorhabditis belari]|uniref:Eyes absent homolog n=1 Tax=Mesorhabditis belari TaxID=2138241 RepID=A0AAF3ED52_9BILA
MMQEETKPFLHLPGSDESSRNGGGSVWCVVPGIQEKVSPSPTPSNTLQAVSSTSPVAASSSGLSSSFMPSLPQSLDRSTISDVAAVYGQSSYYNSGYSATGYGVYGPAATASYYQQVAGLASARVPYLGTPASAYAYSTTPYSTAATAANFDYSAYNQQYYNSVRNGYYGGLTGNGGNGTSSAYQTTSNDTSTDLTAFTLKAEPKKGKSSKKKKGGLNSANEGQFARVFIWDLSDVSVFTQQAFAHVLSKAGFALSPSFSQLKLFVQQVASLNFPPDQNEDNELSNIEDAAIEEQEPVASEPGNCVPEGRSGADAMRRLAHRYIALKQLYSQFAGNLDGLYDLVPSTKKENIDECARQIDSLLGGRHEGAARCIHLVAQRSALSSSSEKYGNVFLSSEGLVNGIVQVLLSRFGQSVPIENVYSCVKTGKESCLERIAARFGKKCSFVVITANGDTMHLAKKEGMPVWPITSGGVDLEKLFTAQSSYLLGRAR